MIQQYLRQLGFTEKEIEVYLSILQKGKIAPSEVSKITDINRTTVYSIAKELIKKGIISEDLSGPSRYLVALPLKELKEREEKELEKRKANLNKAIEELQSISRDAKYTIPKIVFVDGKNLEKYLYKRSKTWSDSVMKRDKTWWGFHDYTYAEHYEKAIDWYWDKIAQKGERLRMLTNLSPIEIKMKKKKYAKQRVMKFWNASKKFTASTWVCGDYLIMLITNQKPHYLVEIHDVALAKNIRDIFKGIWEKIK